MLDYLVTRGGRKIRMPSDDEDARVTAAALSDPDCPPLSDAGAERLLREARPFPDCRRWSELFYSDAVTVFFESGEGWSERIEGVLSDWLKTHSPTDA